ncbi:nucleotide-binding protein [Vallitalea okinawensis]|uniref:nucleotide-binding protein n=1 Tax=Vallitalea okinawensis TaxID=2078660 RepID=UPI000CFC4E3D|nr:ATP-binding protein [Vallitalea okinawensis]
MRIAVLSGKGGAGKTTVSIHLAKLLGYAYVDCDVEEPNGFLFMEPEIQDSQDIRVWVPSIDHSKCDVCKACLANCQFNAIGFNGRQMLVFEHLCHSCQACLLSCTKDAITSNYRSIGIINMGNSQGTTCYEGRLNIGEPMGGPIIEELIKVSPDEAIIDCPPGSSCNVVKANKRTDLAVVVAEPTLFSRHNLHIVVSFLKEQRIPIGVVINKAGEGDEIIEEYCSDKAIPLLGKIPFSRGLSKEFSKGHIIQDDHPIMNDYQAIAKELRSLMK